MTAEIAKEVIAFMEKYNMRSPKEKEKILGIHY